MTAGDVSEVHHLLFEGILVAPGLAPYLAAVVVDRRQGVAQEVGDAVGVGHSQSDERKDTKFCIE